MSEKHIDPLAKYRALLNQMSKDTTGVYPALINDERKLELLIACIKASAISNGLEDLKSALAEGLDLTDVTVPEVK